MKKSYLKIEIDPIKQIIERMKGDEDRFIQIFTGDDRKVQKATYQKYFNVNKDSIADIKKQILVYNDMTSYAVFFNFNPLIKPQRNHKNISKINYIFIDLDDGATEEHMNLILQNLYEKRIKSSYVSKTGHGYHILVPVNLEAEQKDKVKGFLTYLKENVCNKVDVATHTNERLLRIPGSIHKKDEDYKTLETIHSIMPDDELITDNSELILQYQEENLKGKSDSKYISSIKREDIFFSSILRNQSNWKKYVNYLHNAKDRNNYFIKNLGIFLHHNPESSSLAKAFIESFEPARVSALEGWISKSKSDNMNINYFELLKWSKENKLDDFTDLLVEQTRSSFLDEYEVYYLEDEKSDYNTLLYYPQRDYYVQKSMNETINNIYRDCLERGIDLEEELQVEELFDDWKKFNFKKQKMIIFDQLNRKIEKENRIRPVFNLNYEPTENKFIYHNNKKYFNIYSKTALWDYYKKQDKYHFPCIKELIMNLCGNDENNYNWLNNWLSHQIQNPIEKIPTAVIFQGKQGSGKGTFKNLILDNIFGNNCQEINQTHLETSFNDYMLGKQIIVANEVMHNENRLTLPNVLKNIITDPEITVNVKFKKSIKGANFTHWIFCTNSDNPIKIDEDDRRYSVFYSQKMRKGLSYEIRKNLDYELKEYISYLKDLEVSFDDVSNPIWTEAKKEIIDLNKDSVARFKEYSEKFTNINDLYKDLFNNQKSDLLIARGEGVFILSDNFYLIYEQYCEILKERGRFAKQNFSKKMSYYNIKTEVKRINNGIVRVYNLENISNAFFTKEVKNDN